MIRLMTEFNVPHTDSEPMGPEDCETPSPSSLLIAAIRKIPGEELLPYLATIRYLRKFHEMSWRGISDWLFSNGNIKVSHNTLSRFYDAVTTNPRFSEDIGMADREIEDAYNHES